MKRLDMQPGPTYRQAKTTPYLYEARVAVMEWSDAYNSYFSETICSLINFLRQKNIKPEQVKLYEIHQDHETAVETCYCIDNNDLWLSKPRLCLSLIEKYRGYIQQRNCPFRDRNQLACGP